LGPQGQLREILERKQINVARAAPLHWCKCVMRSKVEPTKDVAAPVSPAISTSTLSTLRPGNLVEIQQSQN
jgi:hypothetical protein